MSPDDDQREAQEILEAWRRGEHKTLPLKYPGDRASRKKGGGR